MGRPRIYPIKKCIVCNNDYFTHHKSTRYCSAKCRHIGVTEIRKCERCEKEFEHKKSQGAGRFCSRKCIAIPKPICICPWCEKEFIPKSFKYMKFCSANCGRYFVMSLINANRKHKCKFCNELINLDSIFCNINCERKFKKQREINIQRAKEHNEIQHLWAIKQEQIERNNFLNKMCKRCQNVKRVRKGIVYCSECYKILKKERLIKAKKKQRNDRRQLSILKTALENLNLLPPKQRLKYANRREKENAKREYLLIVKQAAIQIGLI